MTLRTVSRTLLLLVTLWGAIALGGCGGDDGERVVLYTSADDYVAREVVAAFEKETGIRILLVGDTEATKTTGLVNRIRNEAQNPQADVFWSSEVFMTVQLADENLFEPYVSETTRDWPHTFRDDEHRWHGFGLRGRVIVYAPDRVSADDVPSTWLELGRSRYRDRIVMADPRFGTTRGHLGAMLVHWSKEYGEEAYIAYLENLRDNNIRLLTSGNAGVVQAVARGEADFGMTDTDDVWAAQRNGMNVDLVYPTHGSSGDSDDGTLLIPNTVARIKGGPNPEAAARLIEFLLSETVERILVESDSHNIPVRQSLAAEYPQYAVRNPLDVGFAETAAAMDRAVELAMQILSN